MFAIVMYVYVNYTPQVPEEDEDKNLQDKKHDIIPKQFTYISPSTIIPSVY
jgi:hypothetical protein